MQIDRASLRHTMARRAALVLFVAVGLLASGCSLFKARHSTLVDPIVKKHRLGNGMTVFLLENHTVPLVTMDVWVRTGSKDEPAEIAGVSHFLEHMLFKGTPRLAVGEYDRRIEALGGYLNAATSTDYTHYYVMVPSEHMESALADMSDVMLHSSIDEKEVTSERQVILEEIRMKEDNPVGFLYDEVTRQAFTSGPYAGTVIGSSETVTAMSREQLYSHYRRFYAPENMALVAVGDFKPDELLRTIESQFKGFDRKLEPWRDAVPATEFAPPAEKEWERDWQQTYFFVTFPGPAVKTLHEMAVLDVAHGLLLGGRSSRLVNRLREKRKIVTSINGFFPSNIHPSLFVFYGTCDADKVPEARAALMEELATAKDKGFSGEEIRRAKRQIINDHLYSTETNTGQASIIGYSFALFGDERLLAGYPEAIEAVTEGEVTKALQALKNEAASQFVARPAAQAAVR